MKICKKCNKIKELTEFYKSTVNKSGLRNNCKICVNHLSCKWAKNNREKRNISSKLWRDKNPNKLKKYQKNKVLNPANIRIAQLNYYHKRKNNIQFRLAKNLRQRLYMALKRNSKKGSAVKDLGCSVDDLKFWLEFWFEPEMTWDNYGEWEIDHIIPLTKVNLSNRKEFLKVCNYTNLQPMWKKDNIKKLNKLI